MMGDAAGPGGSPWLFHVGYVKTATTFLQRSVFGRAECGFGLPGGRTHRGYLVGHIVMTDGYAIDPHMVRDAFRAAAAPLTQQGLTPVWSEETLLGDPGSRRYDGFANAIKLQRCFPGARILITIREQRAMALSVYKEYLKGSGTQPLEGFIGRGDEAVGYGPILSLDFLAYDRAVKFYRDAFGTENVHVLPYELLRHDRTAYAERLSRFLECPSLTLDAATSFNAALGTTALLAKRWFNRFLVRSPLARDKGAIIGLVDRTFRGVDRMLPTILDKRFERRLRRAVATRYDGMFAESNRALAEMTGLPLSRLGYQT